MRDALIQKFVGDLDKALFGIEPPGVGLRLDIEAPSEKYPSMTGALQHYLLEKQG